MCTLNVTFYSTYSCIVWHNVFFSCFFKIIMHQLVKLTDAIWLLQLVISSPLIHSLGDQGKAPTGIRTWVLSMRSGWLTNWAIPPPPDIMLRCSRWNLSLKWYPRFEMTILISVSHKQYNGSQLLCLPWLNLLNTAFLAKWRSSETKAQRRCVHTKAFPWFMSRHTNINLLFLVTESFHLYNNHDTVNLDTMRIHILLKLLIMNGGWNASFNTHKAKPPQIVDYFISCRHIYKCAVWNFSHFPTFWPKTYQNVIFMVLTILIVMVW